MNKYVFKILNMCDFILTIISKIDFYLIKKYIERHLYIKHTKPNSLHSGVLG